MTPAWTHPQLRTRRTRFTPHDEERRRRGDQKTHRLQVHVSFAAKQIRTARAFESEVPEKGVDCVLFSEGYVQREVSSDVA